MTDEKKNKEEPEAGKPFNRDEWIARAVAAAAMTPGKPKPPIAKKRDSGKV